MGITCCRFDRVLLRVLVLFQILGLVDWMVRQGVSPDTVELIRLELVSRVPRIQVVEGPLEARASFVSARFGGFDRAMGLLGLESARQGRLKEEATFVVGNTRLSRPVRSNCWLILLVQGDLGRCLVEQILAVCQP